MFSGPNAERWDAVLYRADARTYGGDLVSVLFTTFRVLSYTPCGAWIETAEDKKKFVNLRAARQFACASRKEALVSLKMRRNRQIKILSNQLACAEIELDYLNTLVP